MHKCFKKVCIRPKKVDVVEEKLKQLDKLKTENQDRKAIESLEVDIQHTCAAENARLIREQVEHLSDLDGKFSPNLMWKVKERYVRGLVTLPWLKKTAMET